MAIALVSGQGEQSALQRAERGPRRGVGDAHGQRLSSPQSPEKAPRGLLGRSPAAAAAASQGPNGEGRRRPLSRVPVCECAGEAQPPSALSRPQAARCLLRCA